MRWKVYKLACSEYLNSAAASTPLVCIFEDLPDLSADRTFDPSFVVDHLPSSSCFWIRGVTSSFVIILAAARFLCAILTFILKVFHTRIPLVGGRSDPRGRDNSL